MIEVLSARVDAVLTRASACASARDHRAAERRRSAPLQRRTLAGRAALRLLAARCRGLSPEFASALPIDRTCRDCGEPHGQPTSNGLALSSSTSGDRVLVAVADASTRRTALGVDVEVIPDRLWDGFDDDALHSSERGAMPDIGSREGIAERLSLWTQKEASLKATGDGLRIDPAGVHLASQPSPSPPAMPPWRRVHGAGAPEGPPSISVRTLLVGDDASAAIATSDPQHLRLWTLGELAAPSRRPHAASSVTGPRAPSDPS